MRYASKLLLFGEHTVNRGSQALAIPYPAFGGEWRFVEKFPEQQNLLQLADYLEDLHNQNKSLFKLDISLFRKELSEGLYFESNIPIGYGLGSSGALCAAIYDRFCQDKIDRNNPGEFGKLRQHLAQMESFFHGTSSGIDPLICYLHKPVLIHPGGQIQIVKIPQESALTFFLLDTKIARSTGPMVHYFLEKCEEPIFAEKVDNELVAHTNLAIADFLQAEWEHLFEDVTEISRFQMENLQGMTPDHFHAVWKKGLQGNPYRLKMCGAGGGGFILGCTHDWAATQLILSDYSLYVVIW